jgi:hypothetical protein
MIDLDDEELESIKENIKVHHSAKMVFQKYDK